MLLLVVTFIAVAVAVAAAVYAWRVQSADRLRSEARVAALAAAIDGTSDDASATMFEPAPRSGLQGRPLVKVGVGLTMAVLVIVLIAMSGDRERASADEPRAAAQEQANQELELLSMRHRRDGDALMVTGLVRNRGASAAGSIMAVVFVFDRDGGFVASGRAPLEFGAIARGDESPFQVTIPDVKEVGRYRVSFRTQAGIVRHVDLRGTLQVSN
jgi:hypothetical protein